MRQDAAVRHFSASRDELVSLHKHLYHSVREARINLNMVRDIAIVTTPLEGRFLTDDDGFLKALHHKMMGTRLGRRTSAHLSDLRRALRVRRIVEAG